MQVIGQRAFTPDALPKAIRGLSVQLLLAVWGNGDSHIQYLSKASKHQSSTLCTRALSTDTIEGTFAELNSSMGYKANPHQLEPQLHRLRVRWSIRHTPDQIFFALPSKRKRRYSQHCLARSSNKWYDDDWQLTCAFKRQCRVGKTAVKKAKGGEISVRAHYK